MKKLRKQLAQLISDTRKDPDALAAAVLVVGSGVAYASVSPLALAHFLTVLFG